MALVINDRVKETTTTTGTGALTLIVIQLQSLEQQLLAAQIVIVQLTSVQEQKLFFAHYQLQRQCF